MELSTDRTGKEHGEWDGLLNNEGGQETGPGMGRMDRGVGERDRDRDARRGGIQGRIQDFGKEGSG